jgi:hypothetical protein
MQMTKVCSGGILKVNEALVEVSASVASTNGGWENDLPTGGVRRHWLKLTLDNIMLVFFTAKQLGTREYSKLTFSL